MDGWMQSAMDVGVDVGGKVIGALILWYIGKRVITLAEKLIGASMSRQKIDPTLIRYSVSASSVVLNVLLIIAVLGVFGVETTTFAGLLAAAGVAIGMAWSGLLSNFAAGMFMILLRPFKVGDFVTIGGLTGTVKEIGLFVTAIDTPDAVRVFMGNGKIFGGDIHNFSMNPVGCKSRSS